MSLAKEMLDYMKSPEGQKSMEDYFEKLAQKDAIERARAQRIKEHFSNEISFDHLMKRVLEKQNIYDARHYRTYSERALHVTNLLWELASSEGTEIEPIDGLTENFSSMIYNYYGYQFAITHGQGSVLSIYKNKELIYRT
jgi:hypothetical protein